MPATVAQLYRYPVKGLAPETLTSVVVSAGCGVPGDRRFAVARGGTIWDDGRPQWMRKEAFVMLMRDGDERLAALHCSFADDGAVVTVTPPGAAACRVDLCTAEGRAEVSRTLAAWLGPRPDGPPRVVAAGSLSLTDVPQNCLSIVNLASIRDFETRIGRPVHPMRFRANLYLDGLPAWAERDWIGSSVGVGATTLKIEAHIHRCNATRVHPETAARDLDTLRLLKEHYGHIDMGVYAEVTRGGQLRVGDEVAHDGAAPPASAIAGLRNAGFYAKNALILVRSWMRRGV